MPKYSLVEHLTPSGPPPPFLTDPVNKEVSNDIIIGFPLNILENKKIITTIYSYNGLNWEELNDVSYPKNIFSQVKVVYDNNGNYYLTDSTEYCSNEQCTPSYKGKNDKLNIYTSTDCLNWKIIENPILPNNLNLSNSRIESLTYYNNSLLIK